MGAVDPPGKSKTMNTTKANDFGGGNGHPESLRVSEYDVRWLDSGDRDDDDNAIGGLVAVRVDRTGDDSQDWLESDVAATTRADAIEIARRLIAEYEDTQRDAV